ncbi:MAG: transcriptional regulator NrdR [Anaerolineae bacterium]
MRCPYCGSDQSRVIDTRDAGQGTRRRRECQGCGRRFTTYERVTDALMVIKRDGRREPWDAGKILTGIRIASAKRPIPMEEMERLVSRVEEKVFSLGKAEVSSAYVGQLVLEELKALDEVAYIRFATVYLELGDLEAVRAEIDRLLQRT